MTEETRHGRDELLEGVRRRRRIGMQRPGTHTKHDISGGTIDVAGDRATAYPASTMKDRAAFAAWRNFIVLEARDHPKTLSASTGTLSTINRPRGVQHQPKTYSFRVAMFVFG